MFVVSLVTASGGDGRLGRAPFCYARKAGRRSQGADSMLCPNCGHWNDEAEKRCAHCGRLFSEKLPGSWNRSGLAENEPSPRRIVPTPSTEPPRAAPAWKSEIDRKLDAYRERRGQADYMDAELEQEFDEAEDPVEETSLAEGPPPIVPYLPPLGRKPPLRENDPLPFGADPAASGSLPPLHRDSPRGAEPRPPGKLPPPLRGQETTHALPPGRGSNGTSRPAGPSLVPPEITARELLRKTTSPRPPETPSAAAAAPLPQPSPEPRTGEINCPEEVAPLSVRAVALVLDLAMIELAQAFVTVIYIWQTGASVTGSDGIRGMLAVFFTILAFYFYFFLRFGGATAGMVWTGLRILNFDGGFPSVSQLHARAVGTILSFAAAFVGFLWAAVDYEGLTWHDRMSKTFLTCD
jgi:uncharacterized RDD family membrane protein YckC